MDAREKLMQILDKPVFPEGKDPLEAVTDYLLENDVVPVTHANWEPVRAESGGLLCRKKCSLCGFSAVPYSVDLIGFHYCPHCGAKMDGGKNR